LQITNKVTSIKDELILEEIYKLVNLESDMEAVYTLTEAEKKAIDLGLRDIKEGRVYSPEVAKSMLKEWRKK
jgi:predicted transcriptional regulator